MSTQDPRSPGSDSLEARLEELETRLAFQEHALSEMSDALAVVTEWKQFRSPDFARLATTLKDKVVFDGRNLYEPAEVEAAGLAYYGIGRGRSVRVPGGATIRTRNAPRSKRGSSNWRRAWRSRKTRWPT